MEIWNRLISVLDKTILRWVFPPICIHCRELLDQNSYFCRWCLELIDNCFLYRKDINLCRHLRGKSLCIAFENMGPLYALALESHPTYKKLFIQFVKLAYLQSNVFGCDGIIYCDMEKNFPSIAYIAKRMGHGLSLPVYKINRIQKKLYLPLLLYWQPPGKKEGKKIEKKLLQKSIIDRNILVLFDRSS